MPWHTCKVRGQAWVVVLAFYCLWDGVWPMSFCGSSCIHHPFWHRTVLISDASAPSLHGLWASNLRSSCLLGKHVTHADTSKFTHVWISVLVIGLKSLLVHRKSTHSCLMIYNKKKVIYDFEKNFIFFSQEINCISLHILKSAVLIYILSASLVAFII